jgi:hypothetical protein
MKLSPPGSSSDLETARAIARRLSQQTPSREAHDRPLSAPPGGAFVPPPAEPPPAPRPAPPPPQAEPPVVEPPIPPNPDRSVPPPPRAEPDVPPPVFELETEREPDLPDLEPDAETAPSAPPAPEAEAEPELELVADLESAMAEEPPLPPAPPTWTEILQDCLFLARAGGALLINVQGQIAASCGDWPPPGVEAISARLVPAMDKALKDAPTRSVSVPLSGKHLTAWRVPVEGGLLTVGFIADAPLKPEVRPSIDGELKRGQA